MSGPPLVEMTRAAARRTKRMVMRVTCVPWFVLMMAACSSAAETPATCGQGGAAAAAGGAEGTTPAATAAGGAAGAAGATVATTSDLGEPWGPWSACLPHGTVTTCSDYCGSTESTCSDGCPNYYAEGMAGVLTFNDHGCTNYAPGFASACDGDVYGYKAVRCCCLPQ
jgi:hypothetical protein